MCKDGPKLESGKTNFKQTRLSCSMEGCENLTCQTHLNSVCGNCLHEMLNSNEKL